MDSPCSQSCDLVSTMAMIYIRGIVGDAVKLALEQDCQQPGEVRL